MGLSKLPHFSKYLRRRFFTAPSSPVPARNPRATFLCRLFEGHFDEVRGQWERRFQRRYGYWRGLVDEQDLRSSRRAVELVEGRELLMTLGVERYRLGVKGLVEDVCKSPDGMSQALARGGVRRRARYADFRSRLGDLDHAVSQATATQ